MSAELLVEISGPVTKVEVVRWRSVLADFAAKGRNLRLDLASSGPWDFAGLQLLLATMASCERAGQGLCLVAAPQVFLKVAERAELLDRFEVCLES